MAGNYRAAWFDPGTDLAAEVAAALVAVGNRVVDSVQIHWVALGAAVVKDVVLVAWYFVLAAEGYGPVAAHSVDFAAVACYSVMVALDFVGFGAATEVVPA